MNDSQRRKTDKFDREDVFITDNAADFPKGSPVDLLTEEINVERQKILDYDSMQLSGFSSKDSAQGIYDDRRDKLIDLLEKFVLAAKIVEDTVEGTAAKFKNPYPRTDQRLIARATSFFNDSTGLEAEFDDAGADADDRAALLSIRDEFQQASNNRDSGEEHHAEATGGMFEAFRKAMILSSKRDKRVRMKYRKNPAKLAAWTVASHLDRAPKRQPKNNGENPPDNNENPPT